jgi:hypothetical protein
MGLPGDANNTSASPRKSKNADHFWSKAGGGSQRLDAPPFRVCGRDCLKDGIAFRFGLCADYHPSCISRLVWAFAGEGTIK